MGSRKQGIKSSREAKASFRKELCARNRRQKVGVREVWEKRNWQITCVLNDWKKYHWALGRVVEVIAENQANAGKKNNGGSS